MTEYLAPAAVIFDMDGVLIDTEPLWDEAEQRAFLPYGVTLTPDILDQTRGVRNIDVVRGWKERFSLADLDVDDAERDIIDAMVELVAVRGAAKPGVHALIASIRPSGTRLALASSSPKRFIRAVLQTLGLRDAFESILSGDDVRKGKPDPEIYLKSASELGVSPRECLVIEDSAAGIEAARAAGMKCIAVPDSLPLSEATLAHTSHACASLELLASHIIPGRPWTLKVSPHE